MSEENQQPKQKSNFWSFLGATPLKVKLFLISFAILLFSIFLFSFSNDLSVYKKLEESRKKIEEKLKSISLYEGHIEGNQDQVSKVDDQIKVVKDNIEKIESTPAEKTSLDDFFDKRVK